MAVPVVSLSRIELTFVFRGVFWFYPLSELDLVSHFLACAVFLYTLDSLASTLQRHCKLTMWCDVVIGDQEDWSDRGRHDRIISFFGAGETDHMDRR